MVARERQEAEEQDKQKKEERKEGKGNNKIFESSCQFAVVCSSGICSRSSVTFLFPHPDASRMPAHKTPAAMSYAWLSQRKRPRRAK